MRLMHYSLKPKVVKSKKSKALENASSSDAEKTDKAIRKILDEENVKPDKTKSMKLTQKNFLFHLSID